mmetsp:Transcript_20473/g.61159  ORF Transcript_20473/g.61159 Transcript_20473/m.61159 type:complete len:210 (+) Transcript_20473:1175-1804(+)
MHQLDHECLQVPRLVRDGLAPNIKRLHIEDYVVGGRDGSAVHFARLEEVDALVRNIVFQIHHHLSHPLEERAEAVADVHPCLCPKLLVDRLSTLDHARNPKLKVALGAVQCANDQIDNTVVIYLAIRKLVRQVLFLALNLAHDLLGLVVLHREDVRDAEIAEHNSRNFEDLVVALRDNRFIERYGLHKLALLLSRRGDHSLHEENVRNV